MRKKEGGRKSINQSINYVRSFNRGVLIQFSKVLEVLRNQTASCMSLIPRTVGVTCRGSESDTQDTGTLQMCLRSHTRAPLSLDGNRRELGRRNQAGSRRDQGSLEKPHSGMKETLPASEDWILPWKWYCLQCFPDPQEGQAAQPSPAHPDF